MLTYAGGEKDDALAEGVDYVIVISGHECSVQLPEGPLYPHVQVLRIDNRGKWYDGSWSHALQLLGLRAGVEEVVCNIRQHTSAHVSIR